MNTYEVPKTVSRTMVYNTDVETGWVVVSTVLIPGSHPFFETMIFPAIYTEDGEAKINNWRELDCERSYTRTDAIETHFQLVKKWSK